MWELWILAPFFFNPETLLHNSLFVYKPDQAKTSIGNDTLMKGFPSLLIV